MKPGDIILIPFPFAELTNTKIRPAVVIAITKDKYRDVIVSAISSLIPKTIGKNEIILEPTRINKLRVKSVIKVDRIVTIKRDDLINHLGKLTDEELNKFKKVFWNLIR